MDRRSLMMMMTGAAALGAALPVPLAGASPLRPAPPMEPPADAAAGRRYLFQDEFDGPAGSGPDPSKWLVQNWDDAVNPPLAGHYRDDRRNVFIDGNSNLVLCATKEGDQYFSGKVLSQFRGQINTTWEARLRFDMFPGLWPAYWLVNQDPLPDGEVDVVEYYGNEKWAPGTTVHAASNGKTWEGRSIPELVDPGWHTWRVHWGEDGFQFWRDYVDGAEPYFTVPPNPIPVHGNPSDLRWPFGIPGYWMQAVLNVAVGGTGGGDPARAPYPSVMLVDWIRVW